MHQGEYTPPTLTIDSVVFRYSIERGLSVLLIQRTYEPFKGQWALPGGYCAAGETTRDAMNRVLKVKSGLDMDHLGHIEQLYAFDTVARDPRGHAVSVTYMALARDVEPVESATTQSPRFFPLSALPDLAYDHAEIIDYAIQRLRSKLNYTNVAFALLQPLFTLTHLQVCYEAVFGHVLDKRNFRKKILALGFLKESDQIYKAGAHRPARLYAFRDQSLRALDTMNA